LPFDQRRIKEDACAQISPDMFAQYPAAAPSPATSRSRDSCENGTKIRNTPSKQRMLGYWIIRACSPSRASAKPRQQPDRVERGGICSGCRRRFPAAEIRWISACQIGEFTGDPEQAKAVAICATDGTAQRHPVAEPDREVELRREPIVHTRLTTPPTYQKVHLGAIPDSGSTVHSVPLCVFCRFDQSASQAIQ